MKPRKPVTLTAAKITAGGTLVAAILGGLLVYLKPSPATMRAADTSAKSAGEGGAFAIGNVSGENVFVNPLQPQVRTPTGKLEVTDVIVDSHRKDYNAELDFRLINRGDGTLSVSRVRLEAMSVNTVHAVGGVLHYSATYNRDVSHVKKVGEVFEFPVSHSIEAGGTDRFLVKISARDLPDNVFRYWKFRPTLVTSDGEVTTRDVTIALPWDINANDRDPNEQVRQ